MWLKKKKIDQDVDLEDYDAQDAVTFYTTAGNFIFMHKYDDTPHGISILVHELCHATFNVLHAAGVKEEEGNEEAAAYLLDNLTERCIKHLRAQIAKQARAAIGDEEQTSPHGGSSGRRSAES